jgi:hypothetical protein
MYRLAMGPKGPQPVKLLPSEEVGQPRNMFLTRERYSSIEQAEAALLSLKIRCGTKLTQAELYQASAFLELVANAGQV